MSHLGRPKEGSFDASASLAPVADRLSELLDTPVTLLPGGGLQQGASRAGGPAGKRAFFEREKKLTMRH